jgi:hypothetical protein
VRNGRSFRGGPPPPYFEALASHAMVAASIKTMKPPSSRIVKKLDEILKVPLPPSSARRKALALADRDLTGQLHRYLALSEDNSNLVGEKLEASYQGSLNHFFCGRGFFAFLFEFKEDRDLIVKL